MRLRFPFLIESFDHLLVLPPRGGLQEGKTMGYILAGGVSLLF